MGDICFRHMSDIPIMLLQLQKNGICTGGGGGLSELRSVLLWSTNLMPVTKLLMLFN